MVDFCCKPLINNINFPQKSEIMAGNVGEPKTLKAMLDKLDVPNVSVRRTTVIPDAGITAKDNLKWLSENGWEYIVARRSPPLPEEGEFEFRDRPMGASLPFHSQREKRELN